MAEKPIAAPTPAAVPSTLTAPSVPRGTLLRFVIRKVVFPYACCHHGERQRLIVIQN